MTEPLKSIVESIDIAAPRARVWTFLVDPAHVPEWLGCMRYTGRIGSVFYMQMDPDRRAADDVAGATHCEILEMTEPSRFAFSWYLPGTPRTTVTIDLMDAGADDTTVTLEHSGWDLFEPDAIRAIRAALEGGWRSAVLPTLKATVEAG